MTGAGVVKLMQKSAYARHRRVHQSTVTLWAQSARIQLVGGMVEVEASDAMLRHRAGRKCGPKGPRRIPIIFGGVVLERCLICILVKPRSAFYDGERRRCKECACAAMKRRRERMDIENPRWVKERDAMGRAKLVRAYVIKAITNGTNLKARDIPDDLIEAKREQLAMVRARRELLKGLKNEPIQSNARIAL